jgi:hypothetical protein
MSTSGLGSFLLRGRLPGLPVSTFTGVGLGLRPRMSASNTLAASPPPARSRVRLDLFLAGETVRRDGIEGAAIREERRLLPGKRLPTPHRHVDVERVKLDRQT